MQIFPQRILPIDKTAKMKYNNYKDKGSAA